MIPTKIYPRPTGPGWEPEVTDADLLGVSIDAPTHEIEQLLREKRALNNSYLNLRDVVSIADAKIRELAGEPLNHHALQTRSLQRWRTVEQLARGQMTRMRQEVYITREEVNTLIVRWLILTQIEVEPVREMEGRRVNGGILEPTAGSGGRR